MSLGHAPKGKFFFSVIFSFCFYLIFLWVWIIIRFGSQTENVQEDIQSLCSLANLSQRKGRFKGCPPGLTARLVQSQLSVNEFFELGLFIIVSFLFPCGARGQFFPRNWRFLILKKRKNKKNTNRHWIRIPETYIITFSYHDFKMHYTLFFIRNLRSPLVQEVS